jgi:hypothetical protein
MLNKHLLIDVLLTIAEKNPDLFWAYAPDHIDAADMEDLSPSSSLEKEFYSLKDDDLQELFNSIQTNTMGVGLRPKLEGPFPSYEEFKVKRGPNYTYNDWVETIIEYITDKADNPYLNDPRKRTLPDMLGWIAALERIKGTWMDEINDGQFKGADKIGL